MQYRIADAFRILDKSIDENNKKMKNTTDKTKEFYYDSKTKPKSKTKRRSAATV